MEIRRLLWLVASEEKLHGHGIEPDEVEELLVVDR